MSMKEYSIAIGEMLAKEQYAYHPKKKMYSKKSGESSIVVNLNTDEVYFFDGDDGKNTEDPNNILSEIRGKIGAIMNMQAGEPEPTQTAMAIEPDAVEPDLVQKNDIEDYIKTADSLQDEGHTKYLSPNVGKNPRPKTANPFVPTTHEPAQVLSPQPYKPQSITPCVPKDLSIETIKKYINDKATDEEAYVFLQLCQARNLNPFLKDAYLIKYNHTTPASFVVGKDAFMKRAELHGQFDGFEAGIIVECGKNTIDEERVGTFIKQGETLLGGWAKVYRKDRSHHTEISVSLAEFNTGKSSWEKMPATMIRKVALVQALREAFPSELSGMYDSAEMGIEA